MAQPDLIPSVLRIATASFKITTSLYTLADSTGRAGYGIRLLASDTNTFSQTLYRLCQALARVNAPSPRLIITTEDMMHICSQILQPFEKVLARLNPLLDRFQGRERDMAHFGASISWIFASRSKLGLYLDMMKYVEPALACLLAKLEWWQCVGDGDSSHVEVLRMQLAIATGNVTHFLEHSVHIPLSEDRDDCEIPQRHVAVAGPANDTDVVHARLNPQRADRTITLSLDVLSPDDTRFDAILKREIYADVDGHLEGASGRRAVTLYEQIRVSNRHVWDLQIENISIVAAVPKHVVDELGESREQGAEIPRSIPV